MKNFSLLPDSRPFVKSLLPFFLPYGLYTGAGILSDLGLQDWMVQLLKFISVFTCLIFFRMEYRFGKFHLKHAILAIIVTPLLIVSWIYPLRFCLDLGWGPPAANLLSDLSNPDLYFYLRLVNSVLLVALFEELFCRVYLLEYFHHAGKNSKIQSTLDRILSPLDEIPKQLKKLPFSFYSVIGTTLFFSVGHSVSSYISAVLYFSLTNLLYWKTKSLWTCILTHALTNLGIAILVRMRDDFAFLWF